MNLENKELHQMKTLNEYSEEVYKCTKCGLCQAVCPIYEATGLETAVSRGKFTLLHGILSGKIKFSKKISKHLDLCLGCKACQDYCPSGISPEEIILSAKYESSKINGISFIKRFILNNLHSKIRFRLLKLLINIYRSTGLMAIVDKLNISPVATFNSFIKENIKYKKLPAIRSKSSLKLAFFPGCINNYVNPSVKSAILMVLQRNGYNVVIPEGLSCCGIPARSVGDIDSFKKQAEKNIKKISPDIDYLITDCASCGSVWKFYADVLEGELKEKALILADKVININKFLALQEIYIPEGVSFEKTVTYHDPCHLRRFQDVYEEPRQLLKNISGIKYVELEEADKCCGAAGMFCVYQSKISQAISRRKAENIINTNADIVATGCPSCKIGILQGLSSLDKDMPIYQPVEIIAKLYLEELNS